MKLIENAKSLVILIIAALVLGGLGYYKFIYQPNQLKQTIRDQSTAIGTVQKSNEQLLIGVEAKKEAEIIKEAIVEAGEKIKEQNSQDKAKQTEQIETKVESIKKEFNQEIKKATVPEKTVALIIAREKAISKTRIDSLWVNYCRREPSDPDCRGYK